MSDKIITPNYLFEVSWEVCNKIGGIHTVVSTKALTLSKEFKDNLILIGPDVWRHSILNPEFIEDDKLFSAWKLRAAEEGLRIRIGRWNIVGKPIVILVDFSPFISQKDVIFKMFWETYRLDSISGGWDYVEPAIFGYAAGRVVESFCKYNLTVREKVVAHFHEWMTGAGILYIKKSVPQVATLFTTHATAVGRSISGNGLELYKNFTQYNGDAKAKEFNIDSKQSLEKTAAHASDCFTTVSEITARECKQFLEKAVDIVTPNGFEDNFVPAEDELEERRDKARKRMKEVSETLWGCNVSDDAVYVGISGRYEMRNKGLDIFIDTLAKLKQKENFHKEVIGLILVPANNYGPRKDLLERLNKKDKTGLENKFLTHNLHDSEYDQILNHIRKVGITNEKNDKVKIIFIPTYLNGNDGIINMKYYDILSGLDITVFPSYYEPWGYTPLESLAFHIPTITTTLAGFGMWINNQLAGNDDCVGVIERTDDNYHQVVDDIVNRIIINAYKTGLDKKRAKENAYFISKTALWKNFIKYYKEAYSIALQKVTLREEKFIHIIPTEYAAVSKQQKINQPVWKGIVVQPHLSQQFSGLNELAHNIWWSWNYEAAELFEAIDKQLWIKTNQNPILLLKEVSFERMSELQKDWQFINKYNYVYGKFKTYIDAAQNKKGPRIAYFSMEYGLNDTLKIYSGGLGILAGDYLKEASDSNVSLVAVGLLYRNGYFTQRLSLNGEQLVHYEPQTFANLPIAPVNDENGNQIIIQIVFPGRILFAKIWRADVGRIPLYLLDTDLLQNIEADQSITYQLYGGNIENRLKQEMLLGVGGIRALETLGVKSDIYHINEGHAAFIGIERLNRLINRKNFTFAESLEIIRTSTLFTTHTPVPAGHDYFEENLIMTYMGHYPDRLKITWQEFIDLGKMNPGNAERYSMSCLAANMAQEMNGVSMLHGDVTKNMFNRMWDGYFEDELHIGYVTNGVHYPTWTAKEWRILYEKEFGENFLENTANKEFWKEIFNVPDERIWELRQNQRHALFNYLQERLNTNLIRRHVDPRRLVEVKNKISDDALTIGFARRFATYKRAYLLFKNLDRLAEIVNNPEMPVQFLFAGKAHPADGAGQDVIKTIVEISNRPEFIGKILFLENYDMELAKKLVQGVDIWLNTPTRPLEASGTSGMKAVMNGALHFSVLDGWWVEGYKEKAGWALPRENTYENTDYQDELDIATIYNMLEREIIPTYYRRNASGVPNEWVKFIKNSIANIAPQFTTKRMLNDYTNKFYLKLENRHAMMKKDDYAMAKEISSWKKKVVRSWDSIDVVSIDFADPIKAPLVLGEKYAGEVILDLKELSDISIGIEMIITEGNNNKIVKTIELKLMRQEDTRAHYSIELTPSKPGAFNYGLRMYPKNEKLPHRQDFSYVRWI